MIGEQIVWPRAPRMKELERLSLKYHQKVVGIQGAATRLIRVYDLRGEVCVSRDLDYPAVITGITLRWPPAPKWYRFKEALWSAYARRQVRRFIEKQLPASVQFAEVVG